MAELGKFFVTVGSKFDKAGFDKARQAINRVALAGIAMGGALAFASIKAAKAAGVQEQAEFLLASALKNTKNVTGVTIDQLKKYASHLQSVTTVGDETSLGVMQLGLSMGISADEIEGATKQAIGLSKAYKVDLNASMKLVALARAGEFSMMARYIPQLRGMTDRTKMAAIANQAMADGFKIAEAETDTYLGAVAQLKNIIGDLWEDIGFKIIPIFKDYIKIIRDEIVPKIKNWIDESGNIESAIKKIVTVTRIVTTTLYAFAKTIQFTYQSVKIATETFTAWGARINQVKAFLSGATFQAELFGKIAKFHSDRAKKSTDKLKESVMEAGETINDMNALELESFRLKEEGKTEVIATQTEIQNIIAEEDAEHDMTMIEAVNDFYKAQEDKKLKEEEKRIEDRKRMANALSRTIVDGLEMVANVEHLTWKSGTAAFKEALKKRLSYFILQKTQELIAAQIVAMAKAIANATLTFGAAASHIGIIIGTFAGALGSLRGMQSFEKGGIVQGLIGQPQLAVVHGGEEVIPVGGVGARTIINVSVPPITSRRVADEYGDRIGESIMRKLKRNRKL